jgi:seryl-tRNA synthetase
VRVEKELYPQLPHALPVDRRLVERVAGRGRRSATDGVVVTSDLKPSAALLEAAREDLGRLEQVAHERKAERAELQKQLRQAEAEIEAAAAQLLRLAELLGEERSAAESQPSRAQDGTLTGAQIRTTAVAVLLASDSPDRPIHYREWYELLSSAGHSVRGRDPQAVFLTRLSRSPLVVRGPATGSYRLDRTARRRLRHRLELLREQRRMLAHSTETGERGLTAESLVAQLNESALHVSRAERDLADAEATIRELGADDWFIEGSLVDEPEPESKAPAEPEYGPASAAA